LNSNALVTTQYFYF